MDSNYVPFKDYLELSSVAWNSDLVSDLRRLLPPQCGKRTSEYGLLIDDNMINRLPYDSLDDVRCNAHEEFRKNGVEMELDEIDKYQHQIREVRALTTVDNPAHAQFRQNIKTKRKSKKCCVFCKNNGELPTLYNNHVLKDADGKVSCPVLRKYTCPICGLNGDAAHTIRYCPNNTNGASPGLLLFLNSTRDSAGRMKVRK